MAYRNNRGQILIEAIFLIIVMCTVLIYFDHLIHKQRLQTEEYKLSKSKKTRGYYANPKTKSAE